MDEESERFEAAWDSLVNEDATLIDNEDPPPLAVEEETKEATQPAVNWQTQSRTKHEFALKLEAAVSHLPHNTQKLASAWLLKRDSDKNLGRSLLDALRVDSADKRWLKALLADAADYLIAEVGEPLSREELFAQRVEKLGLLEAMRLLELEQQQEDMAEKEYENSLSASPVLDQLLEKVASSALEQASDFTSERMMADYVFSGASAFSRKEDVESLYSAAENHNYQMDEDENMLQDILSSRESPFEEDTRAFVDAEEGYRYDLQEQTEEDGHNEIVDEDTYTKPREDVRASAQDATIKNETSAQDAANKAEKSLTPVWPYLMGGILFAGAVSVVAVRVLKAMKPRASK